MSTQSHVMLMKRLVSLARERDQLRKRIADLELFIDCGGTRENYDELVRCKNCNNYTHFEEVGGMGECEKCFLVLEQEGQEQYDARRGMYPVVPWAPLGRNIRYS